MSYNLSNVSHNVLKFYQQLTGEERRIPFIFDEETLLSSWVNYCSNFKIFWETLLVIIRHRVKIIFSVISSPLTLEWQKCSQNVLKFYQQLTGEERRIPFIFDDFHFCRCRVIGLDITKIAHSAWNNNYLLTYINFVGWFMVLSATFNNISV
jgi:hypothetical protein